MAKRESTGGKRTAVKVPARDFERIGEVVRELDAVMRAIALRPAAHVPTLDAITAICNGNVKGFETLQSRLTGVVSTLSDCANGTKRTKIKAAGPTSTGYFDTMHTNLSSGAHLLYDRYAGRVNPTRAAEGKALIRRDAMNITQVKSLIMAHVKEQTTAGSVKLTKELSEFMPTVYERTYSIKSPQSAGGIVSTMKFAPGQSVPLQTFKASGGMLEQIARDCVAYSKPADNEPTRSSRSDVPLAPLDANVVGDVKPRKKKSKRVDDDKPRKSGDDKRKKRTNHEDPSTSTMPPIAETYDGYSSHVSTGDRVRADILVRTALSDDIFAEGGSDDDELM